MGRGEDDELGVEEACKCKFAKAKEQRATSGASARPSGGTRVRAEVARTRFATALAVAAQTRNALRQRVASTASISEFRRVAALPVCPRAALTVTLRIP